MYNYVLDKGVRPHSLAIILPDFLESCRSAIFREIGNHIKISGWNILRLDPAGLWYYGGNVNRYTLQGYLAEVMRLLDVENQQMKCSDKITLIGHGIGAQIAFQTAYVFSKYMTHVVGIRPIASIDNLIKYHGLQPKTPKRISIKDPEINATRIFDLPATIVDEWVHSIIGSEAFVFKQPSLIISNTKEHTVTAQQMHNVQIMEFPPSAHPISTDTELILKVSNTIQEFITKD